MVLDLTEVSNQLSGLNIPLIYSGGVKNSADVEANLAKLNVDAIGVGNAVVFKNATVECLLIFLLMHLVQSD